MIIRDATAADLGACNQVWASTQPAIGASLLSEQPLALHELSSGRVVVAELDGVIVGFGATLTRSGVTYLADLFVVPERQSSGIGRKLLGALYADDRGPRFTFASRDPRAQWLYEQFGMRVVEPYHYLEARLDGIVPPVTHAELLPAERPEIVVIDAAITGRDRSADIDHALSLGATWYVARRRGERAPTDVGAVAIVAPTWWSPWHPCGCRIGPVMAHNARDIGPILAAALATAVRFPADVDVDVDVVSTFVPSSLPALPTLIGAGFAVIDTDVLMASDDAVIDRHRYVPSVDTP